MNTVFLALFASSAALLLPSGRCGAQENAKMDKQFAALVASNNMLEIRLGQYVSDQGSSKDVKHFAEQMIKDHQQAKDLLEKIASEKSVELPRVLNAQDQENLDRLEKLNGSELDQAYAKQMVADHEAAIEAAESEQRDGSMPEMKFVAAKIFPTLQEHLKMAKDLEAQRTASNEKSAVER